MLTHWIWHIQIQTSRVNAPVAYSALTNRRRVTHICVSKLGHHCFAPSHYLNQCWHISDWSLWNKFQRNLNQNIIISVANIEPYIAVRRHNGSIITSRLGGTLSIVTIGYLALQPICFQKERQLKLKLKTSLCKKYICDDNFYKHRCTFGTCGYGRSVANARNITVLLSCVTGETLGNLISFQFTLRKSHYGDLGLSDFDKYTWNVTL